jgi:hypothetical protein
MKFWLLTITHFKGKQQKYFSIVSDKIKKNALRVRSMADSSVVAVVAPFWEGGSVTLYLRPCANQNTSSG